MNIIDELYGEFMIEGLLKELILSSPVQRLKGVYQGGASYLVNEKWDVTRYEHSIGVMLLIKKLGGSLEEQVAGLLHDVSHTAFSHVIDFVFENKEENYHEKIFASTIAESGIPQILSNYGYDYQSILFDDSKWSILEQPAPALCADRVDYTIRDMYRYGYITKEEVRYFLENLIIWDGKMCLKTVAVAEWFVETYYKEVIDFFMDPLNIYSYDRLAKVIKIALDKNLITLSSLLATDNEVLLLLQSLDDQEIANLLKQLHPNVKVKEDRNEYDLHLKNKVRLIDPPVLWNNKLMRASELSGEVRRMREAAILKFERGTYVKILSSSR